MKNFQDLFVEELKEMYNAENQCFVNMNKVLEHVSSDKLKEVLKGHIQETKAQIKRIEKAAAQMKIDLKNAKSPSMTGLWQEWETLLNMDYSSDVLDAAIVNFVQKIKHFEIASYGALKTFATHLEQELIVDWLEDSIKEEGEFNKKLTEVAEGTMFGGGLNAKACKKSA